MDQSREAALATSSSMQWKGQNHGGQLCVQYLPKKIFEEYGACSCSAFNRFFAVAVEKL